MSMRTDHAPRPDPDGIKVSTSGRTGRAVRVWIAAALAVVVAVSVLLATRPAARPVEPSVAASSGETPPAAAPNRPVKVLPHVPPAAAPPASAPVAAEARPRTEPARDAAGAARPVPVPNDRAAARETAESQGMVADLMRDVAEGLRVQGGSEGIGVYPPKGTDPPKPGIIVPDDFQLPEGYVRYHQVTDDGRRLPPILMFSPDYDFVDADGKPIVLPETGIVPPQMAPPGLAPRMLEIPGEAAGTAR
jgi:hypothetical protein